MNRQDAVWKEDVAKLAEMIKDIRIAMLTTRDAHGRLHSRPMAVQQAEFDGDLWFFTKDPSPKLGEIGKAVQVNVSFADPHRQRYVSVSGSATEVQDHSKIAELWSPIFKAWFPDGLDDPDLALLKVEVDSAEIWDSPPSKAVRLFGVVKAVVTGHEYDAGDHEKIDLAHTAV